MSRAAVAIATRVLLVIFTFVLIVVLAQIALVAARTRFDHAPIGDVLQQAWEGTQDYFSSLFQGSLGEATSTSILGGAGVRWARSCSTRTPRACCSSGLR